MYSYFSGRPSGGGMKGVGGGARNVVPLPRTRRVFARAYLPAIERQAASRCSEQSTPVTDPPPEPALMQMLVVIIVIILNEPTEGRCQHGKLGTWSAAEIKHVVG